MVVGRSCLYYVQRTKDMGVILEPRRKVSPGKTSQGFENLN